MTWLDSGHLETALVAAVLGLVIGWFVPRLVGAVPEPSPVPDAEDQRDGADSDAQDAKPAKPAKITYAELAQRPHLAAAMAAATALGAGVIGASVGFNGPLIFLMPMVPFCVALAYIDARTQLLPTVLILPLHAYVIVAGAVLAWLTDDLDALVRALVAMLLFRSIFWVLWWLPRTGMGFGDVRLTALLTFALGYLGWAEPIVWIYVALPLFVVPRLVVALIRRDRTRLKARTPFGPALIVAAPVGVAVGDLVASSLGY